MRGIGGKAGRAMATENSVAAGPWDLHCHTVYSDGTQTAADLINEARAIGLAGIAITDHDTEKGWDDAIFAARSQHYPLICGSEIEGIERTGGRHISVHVLAWLYDRNDSAIRELFASTQRERMKRAERMTAALAKDYPITWEDVCAQAKRGGETTVGRPHMADALVAAGCYPTRSAAFADAVNFRSKYYIPVHSSDVETVIDAVKAAGGVAGIAHAGSLERNDEILTDRDIKAFAARGLDALEVYHRENSADQRARLLGLARRLDLLVTGGSDWHGKGGKPNRLGENTTDSAVVEQIVARAAMPVID